MTSKPGIAQPLLPVTPVGRLCLAQTEKKEGREGRGKESIELFFCCSLSVRERCCYADQHNSCLWESRLQRDRVRAFVATIFGHKTEVFAVKLEMAKDKKEKRKEKKAMRLEAEKVMKERVAVVKAANQVADPLAALPSFKRFNKNGLDVNMETTRVTDLDDYTKEWLMDLLKANMKESYEKSKLGWNEKNMAEEMYDDPAWYLVARENSESAAPVAFAHFRYELDHDDEVLYIYEIQLEESARRKGLGKFMMMVLELLSHKANMRKIMLTCFTHNPLALKFFRGSMKYERDMKPNEDDVFEEADYEILSKINKKKIAREEPEKPQQHSNHGGG